MALALSAGALAACAGSEDPVDGLLLVTVDTLRADRVGAYGGAYPTPALDRLAREGVLLEHAVTPTPTTAPAHVSLFTGRHPWNHGVLDNAVPLGDVGPTLAEIARSHGLATAAFVSSYILDRRFGFDRGFDHYGFAPNRDYAWRGDHKEQFYARGEATTREAVAWLRGHAERGGGRFLLWVHYFDPHTPYEPPEGFALPADAEVTLPGLGVPPGVSDRRQLAALIRAYQGEVAYADAQVGALLDALEELGLDGDTAVIVTSDHGEGLGDHGLLEHGVNLFDELVRVPLIVRASGLEAGRRLEGSAQLEDLLPTALSLLGIAAPADIDGVDLLPWLRGDASRSPRDAALGRRKHYASRPVLFFERAWPQKWIGRRVGEGRVYDLARDPREQAPQVGEGAPSRLLGQLASGRDASPASAAERSEQDLRALEALGYLE